jgi:hypothetical protein
VITNFEDEFIFRFKSSPKMMMMKVLGWFKLHPMLGKTIGDNYYVFCP